MAAASDPPVLALIGPTGIGKSDLALAVAERHDAVIVAVDAFTVYRQLTIGTAKPTPEDRDRVPHRMVDVLDVEQGCSVQWFQTEAREAIEEAREGGHPVLLTGGSGLYFRAVVDPLEFPPTDPEVRRSVQEVVEADVLGAHRALERSDPDAAARIDPANARRITRALEVVELTGRTFSSYRTAWETHDSRYTGLRVIGLHMPRSEVVARIEQRVRQMLADGWLEECRALHGRQLSTSASQAIGYAELLAHLERGALEEELPGTTEQIAIRTRRFATRQRRWFGADPRVEWTSPDQAATVLDDALGG